MDTNTGSARSEVLFEFLAVGRQMRVAAIDAQTGLEVVVMTPLTVPRSQMQSLALAKLRRQLAKHGKA